MVLGRYFTKLGLVVALAGGLVSCGVIYTAPRVDDGDLYSTDYDVEVIPLTAETAVSANLEPYVPPRLPLAYDVDAYETRVQALPPFPKLDPIPGPVLGPVSTRPTSVPERFPPLGEPQSYRIGITDLLLLSVNTAGTALEDLPGLISAQSKRQGYIVQDDGTIAVPDVGRIPVAGRTIEQAEARIFQALVSAGIDPSFSLEVAEFNSQRVSVSGDVGAPQLLSIGLKPLYLHEAIQLSGGIQTPDPSIAYIELFRDGETYRIAVERFYDDPRAKRVLLKDGDNVFVTADFEVDLENQRFSQVLTRRNLEISEVDYEIRKQELQVGRENAARSQLDAERDLWRERLALGAIERDYVFIAGEAAIQRYELPFENQASLADVLLGAARPRTQTADYAEIYVLRASRDPALTGKVRAYHLDAENAVHLATATEFKMRKNDILFVTEQPITTWNRVISQIVIPRIFFQASSIADLGNN